MYLGENESPVDCTFCGKWIDPMKDEVCEWGSDVPAQLAHLSCCPECAVCDCDDAARNRKRKNPDPNVTFPLDQDNQAICVWCWEVVYRVKRPS